MAAPGARVPLLVVRVGLHPPGCACPWSAGKHTSQEGSLGPARHSRGAGPLHFISIVSKSSTALTRLRLALLGATGVAHGLSWKKARLARAGALRVAAGGKGSHARGHRHRLPLPRNESAMERNLLLRVGPWLPHGLGGAQLRVLVRNICVRGWLGSAQGRL